MSGDDLPEWAQQATADAMDLASRQGCLRARLNLVAPRDGGRRHPVLSGWLVAWDIGNRDDGNRPDNDAMVVPEGSVSVEPGGTAIVRLFPLYPSRWEHVQVGDQVHMKDGDRIIGLATVLERVGPTNEHLVGRWTPFTEVRFRRDFEGVSAGTTGVILDVYDDGYEVEAEAEDGETVWLGAVADGYLEWLGETH